MQLAVDQIICKISRKYFVAPNRDAPDKRTHWYQGLMVAIWNGVSSM